MSWGSLFQKEAAAMTKAQSPIKKRRVAGMASRDDAAEHTGTSAMRCISDD